MNFMFEWQEQCLTRSLRSLVRFCSCHSNIKFISSRHRVISSIYFTIVINVVILFIIIIIIIILITIIVILIIVIVTVVITITIIIIISRSARLSTLNHFILLLTFYVFQFFSQRKLWKGSFILQTKACPKVHNYTFLTTLEYDHSSILHL